MIFIPSNQTTIGLVQKCLMNANTDASSFNVNNERKENPINYTSEDRWCSAPTEEFKSEWWEVTFDHWIYPTNYSFSNNNNNVVPLGWVLQGKKKNQMWINLSVIDSSPIDNNQSEIFNITIDEGPFRTFRFLSSHNGFSGTFYHFCIYKFDLFGMAFHNFFHFSLFKKAYNRPLSLFLIATVKDT